MDNEERLIFATEARRDFSQARMKAFWQELRSRFTGKTNSLLRWDEVQQRLKLRGQRYLGLQNIPIDNIVGTVGRYNDFTRTFLPKKSVNRERWQRLSALAHGLQGFPPIEVYKVGDAYFVIDGNHRVSVARQLGQPTIEAYVIEIPTAVPFDENTTPGELTLKEGYADFLRETRLDILRPGANVMLTEVGMYRQILHHIEVHRYFMGLEQQRDIEWSEAVASWYDNVYMPMVETIRRNRLLEEFPNRTEADLYVWLVRHQEAIHDNYQNYLSPEETALDFIQKMD